MKVRATAKAEVQLSARRDWWRRNRSKAPDLFDTELLTALDQIRSAPNSFPIFAERRGPNRAALSDAEDTVPPLHRAPRGV
jgi:hypothetical protein